MYFPILYRSYTQQYKTPTRFMVIKTDSLNICKPSMGIFCVILNVLSDPIQELYMICSSKNGLCEQLQASYTLSSD